MTAPETDRLLRRLIGGDERAKRCIVERAWTSDDPLLLVAAALIHRRAPALLARATASATSTKERQVVAIAAAHLAGNRERVDALARDHLVDHPDSILIAWIAAAWTEPASPDPTPATNQPTHDPGIQESS